MKFMQLSTGTVLDVNDKAAAEMMAASPAYIAVEEPKTVKSVKSGKNKTTAGGKSAE